MRKTLRETVNENLENNMRTIIVTRDKEIYPIESIYSENTRFIILKTFHPGIRSRKIMVYTDDIEKLETINI